jgi:hypothetical protein
MITADFNCRTGLFAYLCLALLLAGCEPTASSLSGDSSTPDADISITRMVDQDRWDVTYRFNEPVRRANFVVSSEGVRANRFTISTPGARFTTDGDREIVEFDEPVSELRFQHPTIADGFEHGHEFHIPFTNGDVLVYSGYYGIYKAVSASGDEIGINSLRYHFEIDGPGHIVHKGLRSTPSATWDASESEWETFVFFGSLEPQPLLQGQFTALLDPGLPAWVKARFDERMPVLLQEYQQRLFQLDFTPTLFFAAGLPAGNRETGRVLAGARAVAMGINRDEYANEDPFLDFVLNSALLAHENVHLWNAHSVKMRESWLWEGGADTLAQLGLLEKGYVATGYFEWYRKNALTQCLEGLRSAYAAGIGHNDLAYQDVGAFPYRCGYMIGYLSAKALARDTDSDIFSLWSQLFQTSLGSGEEVSGEIYTQQLSHLPLPNPIMAAIRAWTVEPLTQSTANGEPLLNALDDLGETWHRQ